MLVMCCFPSRAVMLEYLKKNLTDEYERHFLWVPVLFGLGISFYFAVPFEVNAFVLIFLTELLLLMIYICRKRRMFVLILSCFLLIASGFSYIKLYSIYQKKHVSFVQNTETIYLKGKILRTDSMPSGKTRVWLKDVSDFENDRTGIYRISVRQKANFANGQCVETVASVMKPSYPLKVGGFEFDRHAFYQGISAIGYALSGIYETDCDAKEGVVGRFSDFINHARSNIASFVAKTLPESEAGIASAILVGDKNLLSEKQYHQYKNTGLAHFLAISGLHMGLVAGFAFFVVRLIFACIPYLVLRFSSKNAAGIFAIAFSLIYLLLSGTSVPAMRAFIMTSVVFLGIIFDRDAISMRMVALSALVILILEPYVILRAGFQMSFAAATALIAFYDMFKQKGYLKKHKGAFARVLYYFICVVLTSLIASVATLPYTLYHFGTFAPYTILGNVLAAPVIAFVVMPFIFLSLVLMPFHLSAPALYISGYGLGLLNALTANVSKLKYADMTLHTMPLGAMILITLGGLWLCLWSKKWRFWGILPIVSGFVFYAFAKTPDILYSADGLTVGIQKSSDELIVFSKKKNKFLLDVWGQGYQHTNLIKSPQKYELDGLFCDENMCVYQDVLSFDLKGQISLDGKPLNTQKNLGGAAYLRQNKSAKHLSVRAQIGHKPWNKN